MLPSCWRNVSDGVDNWWMRCRGTVGVEESENEGAAFCITAQDDLWEMRSGTDWWRSFMPS